MALISRSSRISLAAVRPRDQPLYTTAGDTSEPEDVYAALILGCMKSREEDEDDETAINAAHILCMMKTSSWGENGSRRPDLRTRRHDENGQNGRHSPPSSSPPLVRRSSPAPSAALTTSPSTNSRKRKSPSTGNEDGETRPKRTRRVAGVVAGVEETEGKTVAAKQVRWVAMPDSPRQGVVEEDVVVTRSGRTVRKTPKARGGCWAEDVVDSGSYF